MQAQLKMHNLPADKLSERLLRAVGSRRALATHLAANLPQFCQRAIPVMDGGKVLWNWHHQYICEHLTLAARGDCKRLAIAMPPRSLKSRIVTCSFPAWRWATAPSAKFLCASYSLDLSTELSKSRRDLLLSPWYARMWPAAVQLCPDGNRAGDYSNLAHGRMMATGMDNVVGRGADYIIIDDPLTPQQAYSDAERAAMVRSFQGSLRSRLNDPRTGVIIVVQQRLHRGDLIGTIRDSAEAGDWTFLSLPMVATQDETIVFPISGRIVHRAKGDLLQPARWDKQWCDREAHADPYVWNAEYEQSPGDSSESILKDYWYKNWVHAGTLEKPEGALLLPERFDEVIMAADLAFTATNTSDRVAIGVFGRRGSFKYLLELVWGRLDFTETLQAVRRLVAQYPDYRKIYVERAANGAALISALENEVPGVQGVPALGSKVARYHAVSGQLSRGEVVIPHPSIDHRMRDFVSECAHAGIGGRFDDVADMLALALSQLALATPCGPVIVIDHANRFQRVRDYLDGRSHLNIDPAFGWAITNGRGLYDVSDRELDEFLFEGHLEALPHGTRGDQGLCHNFVSELCGELKNGGAAVALTEELFKSDPSCVERIQAMLDDICSGYERARVDGTCHADEHLLQKLKDLMREEYAAEIVSRNGRRRARGYLQAALMLRIDIAAALAENEHYKKTFPPIVR